MFPLCVIHITLEYFRVIPHLSTILPVADMLTVDEYSNYLVIFTQSERMIITSSYLHCEWRALDEINDPRILPKIRRFEMRQANAVRTEDDDVVLFNPDYVEVERVLDVKVYSNGHLVSTDNLESNGDLHDLRKYTKRPKERNKLRNVREEKNKMKNETVSGDMTLSLTTNTQESVSEIHSTTPLTDDFADSETNSQCPPPQPSNTDEKVADSNQKTTDFEVDSKSPDTVCPSPSEQALSTSEQKDQFANKTDENTPPALKEGETDSSPLETGVLSSNNKVEKDDEIYHKDEDENDDGTSSPINVTYYLVKWRSLAYEDATWEMSQDVDPAKVKEFHKRRYPPKNFVVPRDSDYKVLLFRYVSQIEGLSICFYSQPNNKKYNIAIYLI
ncbi:unnamed protein product [Trichobilharzia regenti]|nr:unnamed protein product [Trichobilharzia regenti]